MTSASRANLRLKSGRHDATVAFGRDRDSQPARPPSEPPVKPPADTAGELVPSHGCVVAGAEALRRMHMVRDVARADASVLLVGETGVGKKHAARMLHESSRRGASTFVQIDCATLAEAGFRRDVLGSARIGGAKARLPRPGLLERARGGTVLLDHVEDLAAVLQASLLGTLDEVGASARAEGNEADVRFIATTRRVLLPDARAGSFRADLYYRVAEIVLHIPPLRERKSEIAPLARHFLTLACSRMGRSTVPILTDRALEVLSEYEWPGNIRELRNVMARTALFCSGDVLDAEAVWIDEAFQPLLEPLTRSACPGSEGTTAETPANMPKSVPTGSERDRILHALEACHGNQKQAAKLLGISRRTLVNRIESLNLPRPRKSFTSARRVERIRARP